MRIVHRDERQNELKVEAQSLEDLWFLTRLLEAGDVVEGSSFRRFKPLGAEKDSGEKKKVRVELRLEKIEFAESANKLRLTGVILSGSPEEYVQQGDHHTIDVETGGRLMIRKVLAPFHRELLKEAGEKQVRATIIVLDDEKATVARLQASGVRFVFEVASQARKRDPKTFDEERKRFFGELLKQAEAAEGKLIVAGPGFAKDSFKKYVSEKSPALLKRISFEVTSNAERSGVYELLKKGIVQRVLGEQRVAKEFELLEELKKRVAKEEGTAVYGMADVAAAVDARAVEQLMILDELLKKKETRQEANVLIDKARRTGAPVAIFDSEDDAGMEFKAFRVAALLRYKMR